MIGYLDCSSGISGDKFLGALIALGLEPAAVTAACRAAGLDARVDARSASSGAVAGTAVTVHSDDSSWRRWADIEPRLATAPLPGPVRDGALRAFTLLAGAEARVHGCEPQEVHFHEVGAADTVADLLGVAMGLHQLGIERLACSPVALGSGTVETRHGTLPIPAPATSELLRGVPCHGGPVESELTTPTGAALLRAHVTYFGPMVPMVPSAIGRGVGSRDLGADLPNVATLTLGQTGPLPDHASWRPLSVLSTSLDHISPEQIAFACEQLLESGALDVWQTPLTMKKGRAGIEVSVVCYPDDESRLSEALARETGSLGIRVNRLERYELVRSTRLRLTPLGEVRFKVGPYGERPEHEDVARIAREKGLSYAQVLERLTQNGASSS